MPTSTICTVRSEHCTHFSMHAKSSSNVEDKGGKLRTAGLAVACIIGGASFGLMALTVPFVLPALRKYCLPYVPATPLQMEKVLYHVKGRPGKIVDLGSGDGRVCIAAAQQDNYAVGYELNPWLVWYSRWRAFVSGVRGQAKFFRKDLWKVNLEGYSTVIIFGVESMMEPLWDKIQREVLSKQQQSVRIIACRFQFPRQHPTISHDMGPHSVWVYDHHSINYYPRGQRGREMSQEATKTTAFEDESADKLSPDVLRALGSSVEVRRMLSNKYLRDLLVEINQSDNPQRSLKAAMNIPVFVEFADECLRVCGLRE